MQNFVINHIYIFLTVAFAVTSQLLIKWQMQYYTFDDFDNIFHKFIFALKLLVNPFILLSIFLTLLSGLSWMIAMTKFEISYAYPYISLGFILIIFSSYVFFNEPITTYKIFAVLFIVTGIFILSREM